MNYYPFYDSGNHPVIEVSSTSRSTADVEPIILEQTDSIRLQFERTVLDNPNEPEHSVFGKLVHERKKKKDASFPSDRLKNSNRFDCNSKGREEEMDGIFCCENGEEEKISKRAVKVGQWLEIALNSDQTYRLYCGLKESYELFESMGKKIPYGSAMYTRIDPSFRQFLSIIQNDPQAAQMIGEKEIFPLVKLLLQRITETSSYDSLKRALSELQDDNLSRLTSSLNLEKLQRVADLMERNLDNSNENFWQSFFSENQWILAQIFSCPCTIFQDKAYVGGKGIDNSSGNVCDFIYRNKISYNIAFVEIKTPCAKILGKEYRHSDGVYSMSAELSGAINQVLNYRDSFSKDYYKLYCKSSEDFKAFSPACVVVIGKVSSFSDDFQIKSFEFFRNALNNIAVITFDELLQRIRDLIALFSEQNNGIEIFDELPFNG